MTTTIARYALWILLCIPMIVLGFWMFWNLFDGVLQESRAKKQKKDKQTAKTEHRRAFDEEYHRHRGDF